MSIESMIKNGERTLMEFKVEVPPNSRTYIKEVVAFSNTSGGTLIFGVEDNGAIRGLSEEGISRKRDAVSDAISKVCTPVPDFDTEIVSVDGKLLIVVTVHPVPNRPYYLASEGMKAGTYVRIDAISKVADAAALKELQLEGKKDSFDAKVNFDTEVTEEVTDRICSDLTKIAKEDITVQDLINAKVIVKRGNGYAPTNAYALLQGGVFAFTEVKCALFKGLEKRLDKTMFLDRRECVGPIYQQIEDAYTFVLKNIRLESYSTRGIAREDEYEIPHEVIREILTNAVLHRSYIRSNMPTYVAIYDDRIEVISPGKLYGGMTVKQMLDGKTERRNPVIGKIFALTHISEGWGRGVKGMVAECVDHGLKEPLFEEWGEDFRVTLYRKPIAVPIDSPTLSEIDQKIVAIIKSNPSVTYQSLSSELEISVSSLKRRILYLRSEGIVERVGSTKSGYWLVK